MARIIHETLGRNYQVPGLPYDQAFIYVRPILFDDVPSMEEISRSLAEVSIDTLVNPWSLQVIKGFRDYIPTTFKRITNGMAAPQLEELFGVDRNWVPEADRILLQLQTETEAKGATLDAAIIHNRRELGTVVNKAHVLNRLYMIGRIYGHLKERDYPFLFGDLMDETKWDDALSQMKLQFIEYLRELPLGSRTYRIQTRKADVGTAELREYPFIEWLQRKLGDNFLGALLYGSAARTNDPSKFNDYDNWVRVRDVSAAHRALRGTKPEVVDGRVIEGGDEGIPGAKHLGIHLFPEEDEYLYRHILFLHDSKEFRKHTRVLYGEFPFPRVQMDEVVERGVSHAYVKLKTIAGSLNWAYNAPEEIIGKPSLFEFIVKNLRFFKQHSLNAMGTPKFRDKQELDALLAQEGLAIPPYKPDAQYIRESLVYALHSVLRLQKAFLEYDRVPKFDFVARASGPALVESPWEQYDDLN
jgi:predicted nucleotidyltransferase